jgi:hypothetical protein
MLSRNTGTVLPFLDFWNDMLCDLADHFRRNLYAIQAFDLVVDIASRHTLEK